MREITFFDNYTMIADVCTIAICMVCLILIQSTYTLKKNSLAWFRTAGLLVMFSACAKIGYHSILSGTMTPVSHLFVYVLRDFSNFALGLSLLSFIQYFMELVSIDDYLHRFINLLSWGGFMAYAFVEVISPVARFGFYIDRHHTVHENGYMNCFGFFYIYMAVLIAWLLFHYKKRFLKRVFYGILTVCGLAVILVLSQGFLRQTSFTCISFTFPIISVLFLFHYNAYDNETKTLDAISFQSYMRQKRGKDLTLICLYIKSLNLEKMREMAGGFSQLMDKYLDDATTFRIRDDRIYFALQKDGKKHSAVNLENIIEELKKLCNKFRLEYRLVILHSDREIVTGSDYIALNEFVEDYIPMNTHYICGQQDIDKFLKARYILSELQDIHVLQNLSDERVKVFCQPVLDTSKNTFTSAEALMRLELEGCGMVYPDQFIPIAERHGYIHTLSLIILNKTCRYIKRLLAQGYELERVSVNISMTELKNPDFCNEIEGIIRDNQLDFDKIAIELTESMNETEYENVKHIMSTLHEVGIKFYLDDFGTGYSNFERIIGLPIDIIKFDRSLTIMAAEGGSSRYLVGSFSDIFKNSNYQILFEGVEDDCDEERCKQMNALYLQGYKYSKPIPITQLHEFLEHGKISA